MPSSSAAPVTPAAPPPDSDRPEAHVVLDCVSRRFELSQTLGDRVDRWLGRKGRSHGVQAVDSVHLHIARGEVLGLVGESGCGKSTLGRIVAGILAPSSGQITIAGEPVMSPGPGARKQTTRVQMIFQDPYASLDPRMPIGDQLAEGPVFHHLVTRAQASAYVGTWLERVGLDASASARYPHQFSGGQRQRIAVARALAMQPDTLVCDEPVASLDVSIQAQVLNLLLDLRRSLGLTMLFISHHLGVVRHLSDRVAIMYLGRIVESGPADQIYASPGHPYTQALLKSVPELTLDGDEAASFQPIEGELPSPLDPPPGCHFHLRCAFAQAPCKTVRPELQVVSAGRQVACLRSSEWMRTD